MNHLRMLCFVFSVISLQSLAQSPQEEVDFWSEFHETKWQCTGIWSDGSPFKQELHFEWDIPGKVVHTTTWGNTSLTDFEWGIRSSGIRMIEQHQFWEFDVFGNVTTGTFLIEGQNLYYSYAYDTEQGTMQLTDGWEVDTTGNYIFRVGNYQDGAWKTVWMKATCERVQEP